MSVDNAADSLRENEFLFAMLKPVELTLGIGCGVDYGNCTIRCSENDKLALVRGWQSSSEAGACEISVLQVLVHFGLDVQDSLEFHIVLPDDEVTLLADSHEINIILL